MRKWEISTGRCIRVWHFTKEVKHVAWCPRLGNIISACVGAAVVLIDSADGQCKIQTKSDQFYIHCFSNLRTLFVDSGQYSTGQHEAQIPNMEITEHTTPKWAERSGMIFVLHSADVTKVIWHHKGCGGQASFLFTCALPSFSATISGTTLHPWFPMGSM